MKQVRELILTDEIATQDIKNNAKKKSSEEAVEVVNKIEKIIRSNKCCILWLAYPKGKIFETFKPKEKFITILTSAGRQWLSKYQL